MCICTWWHDSIDIHNRWGSGTYDSTQLHTFGWSLSLQVVIGWLSLGSGEAHSSSQGQHLPFGVGDLGRRHHHHQWTRPQLAEDQKRMSNDVKSQCMIFNLRNCVFRCCMNSPQASSVQSGRALELSPCRGSDSYLGCSLHEWSMNVSRECEWLTCINELCHFDLWVQQIWPSERPYRVPCPWWIDSLC